MSAEQAAEEGVIVGTPYTPPGRNSVFDVPAYDDIADLQLLFKRFANTAASYQEAGGNVEARTDAFVVQPTDVGSVFMCSFDSVKTATLSALIQPTDGMKVSVVQLGIGAVQFVSEGAPVKGIIQTPAQYQGIQAIFSGGTWWCVPFGGSGGGPSGPVPVFPITADKTLIADYIGGVLAVDVSDNKDKTITVPLDDGTIPIGSVIVVSNVGPLSVPKVNLEGADGVILQDRALATVNRWRSAALIKRQKNVWLISAGTGGGQTGSVPTPPTITSAEAIGAGARLSWTLPEDDGGHSITAHVLEGTTDGFTWDPLWSFSAVATSGDALGLTPNVEYTLRLRSENVVGFSDASNPVKVTPLVPYNLASGGQESEYTDGQGKRWRQHVFLSEGTLIVSRNPNPFRIICVAGGQGGGGGATGWGGSGGAGGNILNTLGALPVGNAAVFVGSGGGGNNQSVGSLGGASICGSYSSSAGNPSGAGGASAPLGYNQNGFPGGDGVPLPVSGGTQVFGGGGGGGGCSEADSDLPVSGGPGGVGGGGSGGGADYHEPQNGAPGGVNTGGGGGGGSRGRDNYFGSGGNGGSGVVIVAYEIG